MSIKEIHELANWKTLPRLFILLVSLISSYSPALFFSETITFYQTSLSAERERFFPFSR